MVNLILYSFDIIYIAHLSHSFAILIAVDFKTSKSLINSSTQDLRSFGVTYENTYISLISVSTDTLWRLNWVAAAACSRYEYAPPLQWKLLHSWVKFIVYFLVVTERGDRPIKSGL